jgi:protein phosphatase
MDGSALGTVSRAEITRAVGGEDLLQLDQVADSVVAGDRFLLCSDGLYTSLAESEIVAILAGQAAEGAAQSLIDTARRAGARDNVTAVIVDVHASA